MSVDPHTMRRESLFNHMIQRVRNVATVCEELISYAPTGAKRLAIQAFKVGVNGSGSFSHS